MKNNMNVGFTGTGSVGNIDCKGAYAHSFGALTDETRYSDPWNSIDFREELKNRMSIGMKALETTAGGVGTAGFALVPIYVDPRIVDQTRKFTPLVELIPRVTNQGMTADYNIITAKGGAYVAAEDAATPETTDTYDRASTPIKFLYSVGRVTGQMQAAMPSYILEGFQPSGEGLGGGSPFSAVGAPNAKQMEVLLKARSLRELEEELILNGSISDDANEFDGLVTLQTAATTNEVDVDGGALTWDDIETAVRYAFDDGGRPKLAVASSAVVQDIRKLIVDLYRYNPRDMADSLPFGVNASILLSTLVGDIPLIPSMFLTNTSGSKQIFFFDTDWIEMRVLQDMTYEDLAHTNDSQKFMLKIYECIINRNVAFSSYVDNIY